MDSFVRSFVRSVGRSASDSKSSSCVIFQSMHAWNEGILHFYAVWKHGDGDHGPLASFLFLALGAVSIRHTEWNFTFRHFSSSVRWIVEFLYFVRMGSKFFAGTEFGGRDKWDKPGQTRLVLFGFHQEEKKMSCGLCDYC